MELMRLHAADLAHLAPELALLIATAVLTILDLLLPKRIGRRLTAWLSLAALLVTAVLVFVRLGDEPVSLLNNSYRVDDFGSLFKLLFLGGAALVVLLGIGSLKEDDIPHLGELYYLVLPATLGAMVMVSSADLITMFVGLELLSITSYILVGMRKNSIASTEASFKYVVLGSIASAFILYGISFMYGIAGSANIADIRRSGVLVMSMDEYGMLMYVSFFLMLAGFAFKIAAAPFHQWAPDVYQGAPLPVMAFLATVSKAAAIAMLFRVGYVLFISVGSADMPLSDDVFLAFAVLAAAAMIVGNALALRQRNMKRLLAYSGVANAGYLLVPLTEQMTNYHVNNFSELYYYLVAYFLMNIGAVAVVSVVSAAADGSEEMSAFAGLYHRSPATAIAMTILVLSLAGLPVTAGFFGKLYILLGALHVGLRWLAVIMILTSVMSYYYYFAIVRQMFMRPGPEDREVRVGAPQGIVIWLAAAATVVLGLFPQWTISGITGMFELARDFFFM
jgi:NADH-quinone oxidoreductase subunit N